MPSSKFAAHDLRKLTFLNLFNLFGRDATSDHDERFSVQGFARGLVWLKLPEFFLKQ